MNTETIKLIESTKSCRAFKQEEISKEVLDKIGNDSVLRYKDGKYIYEEELTQKFFDN